MAESVLIGGAGLVDDDDAIIPPLMSDDEDEICSVADACSDDGTATCSDDGAGLWVWMCASGSDSIAGKGTVCASSFAAHDLASTHRYCF